MLIKLLIFSLNRMLECSTNIRIEWIHLNVEQKSVLTTALKVANRQRFLHWEIEFTEMFFGGVAGTSQVIELKKDLGFDAVMGRSSL